MTPDQQGPASVDVELAQRSDGWREAAARIIDPDAWAYFDTDAGQHNGTDLLRFDAWKQSSLRKAAAIAALPDPLVVLEGGGSSRFQPCGAGPSDLADPQSQHSDGEDT